MWTHRKLLKICFALMALLAACFSMTPFALAATDEGNPSELERETSHFRGGGPKVKVELRSRHHKIVFALITTTFYCVDSEGLQHHEKIRGFIGKKGLLIPNVDWPAIVNDGIPIRSGGHFDFRIRGAGPLTWIEDMSGVARTGGVNGRFRLRIDQEESHCRTGGFNPSDPFVAFNAKVVRKRGSAAKSS
jgi:hypothetical protein